MRIKSYFAASVQAAIAIARREFGDGVTLVTSHIAPPDARHLGEYEVVFAVEDEPVAATVEPPVAAAPEAAKIKPAFTGFQEALIAAVAEQRTEAPPSVESKLEQVERLLAEIGIAEPTVAALMTIISQASSTERPAGPARVQAPEPAPRPTSALTRKALPPAPAAPPPTLAARSVKAPARDGGLSAAEMAFVLSVENQPDKGAGRR